MVPILIYVTLDGYALLNMFALLLNSIYFISAFFLFICAVAFSKLSVERSAALMNNNAHGGGTWRPSLNAFDRRFFHRLSLHLT